MKEACLIVGFSYVYRLHYSAGQVRKKPTFLCVKKMYIFTRIKQILLVRKKPVGESECFEVCFSSEEIVFNALKCALFTRRILSFSLLASSNRVHCRFFVHLGKGEGEIMSENAYRFTNMDCTVHSTQEGELDEYKQVFFFEIQIL